MSSRDVEGGIRTRSMHGWERGVKRKTRCVSRELYLVKMKSNPNRYHYGGERKRDEDGRDIENKRAM